jgi:hypothetical protein
MTRKNYGVTRLQYHLCGVCLSSSCHQHVILSEVPDCSWFARINAGGYGKSLYLYVLKIHDYYRSSSVVTLILHSKVGSYGYGHVTGLQLSCIWQYNSCRTCDSTTVVHVTGQQLYMLQYNSCRTYDSTTVVVHVTVQQLSFMWQDNSCLAYDRTTVVVNVTGQ